MLFLTISRLWEVDISVSQGPPGDHVPADPNGEHRSGGAEFLVQHRLRDVGVQVANVERSHRITPGRCVHISGFTQEENTKVPSNTPEKIPIWRIPGPSCVNSWKESATIEKAMFSEVFLLWRQQGLLLGFLKILLFFFLKRVYFFNYKIVFI